ncbi:MAG: anthranilate synthase component I family protein [Planctomycetia bacterium]
MTTPGIAHPWIARHFFTASGCLVAEAAAEVTSDVVFARLSGLPHLLFLDSSQTDTPPAPAADASVAAAAAGPRLGRWSFVAADPIHSVQPAAAGIAEEDAARLAGAFAMLRTLLADIACPTIPGLPPFQGGVAGFVSYECGLVRLGIPAPAGGPLPLLSLHAYDVVFAYDHDLGRGWFISQGVPARGPGARRARSMERLAVMLAAADARTAPQPPARGEASKPLPLPAAFAHPLPSRSGVIATHTPTSYRDMVQTGFDFVRAGDIFQVNLAQHFALAADVDPIALHLAARRTNPAPFAAYFDAGRAAVVSMSPERFLQVSRGAVRMHPIKGTRRIVSRPEADLYAGDDLEASGKDRAENVMIVDLIRNDLARVCLPASVRVEALCRLERYRYVQHLVSIVAGRLAPGLGPLDAIEAAIPGGSVTGAPKHRACEIIQFLEPVARNAYCGSLGYIGFDGTADFNLLIRTFVVAPGAISFAAGGGITAASDPVAEHAESLHKAEGLLRVLDGLGLGDRPGAAADAGTEQADTAAAMPREVAS